MQASGLRFRDAAETTITWSALMAISTASRERTEPAAGSGLDRPRETEETPRGPRRRSDADEPKRDQPGPISPELAYLPDGPKDPLPRVWPAEPETE
jgi:hypothetical protein